jgi:hypothetical protein
MGAIIVGEVGEVGDVGECTLPLALDMLLPEEAERRRDSSMVAWRLTFACEYGVADVSRISMNFEDDMVEVCADFSFSSDVRVGAADVVQRWSYRSIERSNRALLL